MASNEVNVPIRNLKFATMKVTTYFTREFKIRMWLFKWLIWLAAAVMQCDVEIVTGDKK